MSTQLRQAVFLLLVPILGGLLVWAALGLPAFGEVRDSLGSRITAAAPAERHLTNVVTAVNFDYRSFDTLGEEFILFVSVVGVALLLRDEGNRLGTPPPEESRAYVRPSDAVRALGLVLIVLNNLFGVYIVAHAHLTPGGGFQGGVILGTGSLLVYLATTYRRYTRLTPKPMLDAVEAGGAGGYALIGLLGLLGGGAFLENVLPLGEAGCVFSAGTIPLINASVALAVTAGFTMLFREFLEEIPIYQK